MRHSTTFICMIALGLPAVTHAQTTAQATTAPVTQPTTQAAAATAPVVEATPAPRSFSDRYGMLGERSIFLKERRRPRDDNDRTPSTSPAIVLTPEQQYILRGVVLENADLRAYLENIRTGEVTRVAPGANVARGQVMAIEADAIQFAYDGTTTWVEVGQDMTGGKAANVSGAVVTTAPATTGGAAVAPPASADQAAILERMRARRNRTGQ